MAFETPDRFDAGAVAGPLAQLAAVAETLGADDLRAEASDAIRRLADRRFFVACVGQFKRGKSTLVNALVGQAVLPVGVAPVTSVVTVLRAGPSASARVRWRDGREATADLASLADFVDERRNPGNAKGVGALEVFLPAPILQDGLCLVDTPGVGSVFEANTEATRAFLPQVDAALVVLGADPPVSDVELRMVVELAAQVDDLVFVLNKADRCSPADLREASAFTTRVLAQSLGRVCAPPLEVSAAERLTSGRATRDWAELEARLRDLATTRRQTLVAGAEARAVRRLAGKLTHEISERLGALTRPLSVSAARVVRLRAALANVERALADLSYLFASAEAELAREFEGMREGFLAEAVPAADRAISAWVEQHFAHERPGRLRPRALDHARDTAQAAIDQWRHAIEPRAEALYDAVTRRFVDLANQCLERLTAGDAADGLRVEPGFQERRHFYFASLMALTATSPASWIADRLLPRSWRRGPVLRAAQAYARHLLHTNAMRVDYDLRERVLGSRRWLERTVRQRLTEAVAVAERALRDADLHLSQGAEALQARIASLEALRQQVESSMRGS